MVEFEIKSRVQPVGRRKGQTVYYAQPKTSDRLNYEMVVEQIVSATSLSAGDVRNALISLEDVVCRALEMGIGVDLAELGAFRIVVPSKMMDTPEEVTAKNALKTPKIIFTPKRRMLRAAHAVKVSIDRPAAGAPQDGAEE